MGSSDGKPKTYKSAHNRQAYTAAGIVVLIMTIAAFAMRAHNEASDLRLRKAKAHYAGDDLDDGLVVLEDLGYAAPVVMEGSEDVVRAKQFGTSRPREGVADSVPSETTNDAKAVEEAEVSEPDRGQSVGSAVSEAAIATSGAFDQPQHICPGKSSSRGINKGGPKKNVDLIKEVLDNLADARVPSVKPRSGTPVGATEYVSINCTFLTRECAMGNTPTGRRVQTLLNQSNDKYRSTLEKIIDLKPGSLGSCALIGNSENMLKKSYGSEIDQHDTVFRHNTPVNKKYKSKIGVKSDIIWIKGRYKKEYHMSGASMAYVLPKGVTQVSKNFRHMGKPILIRAMNAKGISRTKRLLYSLYGANTKRRHPSGGYSRPFNVIASKLW